MLVVPQQIRRLLVQGIVRIGITEQKRKPVYHRVDIQHRFPVLPQDIDTDVPLEIDVGVVDFGVAYDLGGFVGVVGGHGEGEAVAGASPVPFVGGDEYVEGGEVVGVGEVYGGDAVEVAEAGNVFLQPYLTRSLLFPSLIPGFRFSSLDAADPA